MKTPMQEFLKENGIEDDYLYSTTIKDGFKLKVLSSVLEAYLKHRVEAITDEEILECVKHSDNGITVYRDGVSSIRNFKNKLLKQ